MLIRSFGLLLRNRIALCYSVAGVQQGTWRAFTSKDENEERSTVSSPDQWRKAQLKNLSQQFQEPLEIKSDDELQPTWKDMESRVVKRRTLTFEERGRSGRANVRPTEEEAWLKAGLYDDHDDSDESQER